MSLFKNACRYIIHIQTQGTGENNTFLLESVFVINFAKSEKLMQGVIMLR
jgi:hypothetical protein